MLDPGQFGVPVRVVGLLPGFRALEADLVFAQELPQPFPSDRHHPLRVAREVGGEFAQALAGERLLEDAVGFAAGAEEAAVLGVCR
ncbi:hypothetical protein ACIQUM_05210 [Amycolatopsis azurea]|uniref:hypothetical protein n=1 Tax=Amycolatopsis azurea TaxID=36819 RepID=UPI0038305ABB